VLRRPNWRLIALVLCGVLLLAYVVAWMRMGQLEIARSDFTNTYISATLVRDGHGAQTYDSQVETQLHGQLDPADKGGNLPFEAPPLAAAIAMPISFLPLDAAFRVWGVLQVTLIMIGLLVALRAAPNASRRPRDTLTIAALALSCVGSFAMLVEAQWDGVMALGLGVAYAGLRRHRPASAGAALALTALIAKPQLSLCLAAFVIGRRDRRLLSGAGVAVLVAVGLSVAVVGPQGSAGFLRGLSQWTTLRDLSSFESLIGIAATLTRNTITANVVALVGAAGAVTLAAVLGWAVRDRPERLEPGLAAAAILSLLLAPHAFVQDLALLVPVAGWTLAALWPEGRGPSAPLKPAIYLWVALNASAGWDLASTGPTALGPIGPWVLAAAAGFAATICFKQAAGPLTYHPPHPPLASTHRPSRMSAAATLKLDEAAPGLDGRGD
jgi:hypothetical protein